MIDLFAKKNKREIETRRLGNVRSHIKFRPRSSTFSLNCLTNEEEIKKLTYQHIVQQTTKRIKQSTLEGP